MLLSEAIEEYLLDGVQGGWSASTQKQYRWHLSHWLTWCTDHQIALLAGLNRHNLRQWSAGLRTTWQPATIRQAVMALRGFLAWSHHEALVVADHSSVLSVPRVPRKIQRSIESEEVLALLRQCQIPAATGLAESVALTVCLRNAAVVSLLYDSLLRAAELCRLRIGDLDLDRHVLKVVVKGGNEQAGRFSQQTAERLRAWLNVRVAADDVDTVFVAVAGNAPGQALTTRGLRSILKHLGERAGIPHVTTHAFRRGGAVQAIRSGAPTRVVQEFGRWSNVSMVELYTKALDAGELYERYSPIANLNGKEPELVP